jgi:hypothetical protein
VQDYATGLFVIAIVLLLWVWVQTAWRRTFPDASDDPDVLAQRVGCHTCERSPVCDRGVADAGMTEEDRG